MSGGGARLYDSHSHSSQIRRLLRGGKYFLVVIVDVVVGTNVNRDAGAAGGFREVDGNVEKRVPLILESCWSGCEKEADYFPTVVEDEESLAFAQRLPSGVTQVGRSPQRFLLNRHDVSWS